MYYLSTPILCSKSFHLTSRCTGFASVFVSYFQVFFTYFSLGPVYKFRLCNCSVTHSPTCKICLWVGPGGSQLTVSATLACSYALLWTAIVFTGMIFFQWTSDTFNYYSHLVFKAYSTDTMQCSICDCILV